MSISFVRVSVRLGFSAFALLFLTTHPPRLSAQPLPQDPVLSKDQQDARDALNQGVAAFKNAQFDDAEQLFLRAKQLDPSLQNASLYLATTYASQYIPGAPSEDNVQKGKLAAQEYKEVLERDPTNLSAIDGLASILYQMAGQPFRAELFDQSKSYSKKHSELAPNDPQPYYFIGVIDWALAYRANTLLRQEFNQSVGGEGLKADEPLPETVRRKYAEDCEAMIDEGIDSLKHAIQLKPDYDDAMTYLNLMYRRKADVASTPAEREEWNRMADDLLDQVKEIKMKRAEAPPQ